MKEIRLAGCVIRDDQGRVLLLHRNTPKLSQWEIPGGKSDPGEDGPTTAARELREEVGIEVEINRYLGCCNFIEDGTSMSYTWFLARIRSGTPRVVEHHRHDRCEFLDIDQISRIEAELSATAKSLLHKINARTITLD